MLHTKVRQVLGHLPAFEEVLRVYTRYCCRLCSAGGINTLYGLSLSPTQRDGLRALKQWIDHNTYRNLLYRAIWQICRHRRPRYAPVARRFGLDRDELRYLFLLLSEEDRREIARVPEPQACSAREVLRVVQALQHQIRNLAQHRLRYAWQNDCALSREDFQADLQCQAIKIIRHYEILGLPTEKLIPLVARGLTNHAKNLAGYYGKERRNPLRQLQRRRTTVKLWYCNIHTEIVEAAECSTDPEHRRLGEYCLASFEGRPAAYIHVGRLYRQQKEAQEALRRYKRGEPSRPSSAVDLTAAQQDDWCPTCTSLDTPAKQDGAPRLNFLPADNTSPDSFAVEDLIRTVTDPRARMFFEVVRGDLEPMFDSYCQKVTGRSSAELSPGMLGRVARRYCGISRKELTALLPRPT